MYDSMKMAIARQWKLYKIALHTTSNPIWRKDYYRIYLIIIYS